MIWRISDCCLHCRPFTASASLLIIDTTDLVMAGKTQLYLESLQLCSVSFVDASDLGMTCLSQSFHLLR